MLHAIASGRTRYGEMGDDVKAEPQRTLERLGELDLVERVLPLGESERTKRRSYRVIDPFLQFHLRTVAPYRTEIERGLGRSILSVLREAVDAQMGDVWEESFRGELRRCADAGTLSVDDDLVAIGSWWDTNSRYEIDALVLSGRPVMVGEAKWARKQSAATLVQTLRRKVELGWVRIRPRCATPCAPGPP